MASNEAQIKNGAKEFENDRGRLFTPTTASAAYGIGRQKIYWLIRKHSFPVAKLKKSVFFWEKDFLNFISSNTIPADDEDNNA